MVYCYCVHNVYVAANSWTERNFCYTVNICMICHPCGLSCECPDFQNDKTPCHTIDICMASLHCEFCCVQQGNLMLKMSCCNQYIQIISLLNDFVCALLDVDWFHNICHILNICIYLYEYSYDNIDYDVMKRLSHTEYKYTSLQCVILCVWSNYLSL